MSETQPKFMTPAQRRESAIETMAYRRDLNDRFRNERIGRELTDDEQKEMDSRKTMMSDSDMLAALDQAEGISAEVACKALDQISHHLRMYSRRYARFIAEIYEAKGRHADPKKLPSVEVEIDVDKTRKARNGNKYRYLELKLADGRVKRVCDFDNLFADFKCGDKLVINHDDSQQYFTPVVIARAS